MPLPCPAAVFPQPPGTPLAGMSLWRDNEYCRGNGYYRSINNIENSNAQLIIVVVVVVVVKVLIITPNLGYNVVTICL